MYYLQSRYYDPNTGRFLNADALISTGEGLLGNNMFTYCLNDPVCRKDIPGTTSQEIFDNDLDHTDNDKEFAGGKTSVNSGAEQTIGAGNRDSVSNSSSTQNGSSNEPTSDDNASSIPQYAYDTLKYVKDHNGSPPKGYKGGSPFSNDGRNGSANLPDCYAPYREYDVFPKVAGLNRGAERIVIGIGAAFYTPNHYMTFIRME